VECIKRKGEIHMKDYDLEEFVNPCVVEKLAKIYENDETYQRLLKEADMIFDKLNEEITDEQSSLLEQYFEATVATTARRDTLTYIQGMKNMYNLAMTLQDKE